MYNVLAASDSVLFDHQEYSFETFEDKVVESGPTDYWTVMLFAVIDHVIVCSVWVIQEA